MAPASDKPASSAETVASGSAPTIVGGTASTVVAKTPQPPVIPGYAVERLLGRGGMGEVWLARQETLDRQVAIKVIRAEVLNEPAYTARFLREARAAAKVNHPHVVAVHDAGHCDHGLFLVMEYVPGGDLHDACAGKPLDEARLVRILRAAAEGLQAIHDAGLLHRDLKPENIFLGADGLPKIGDLGLARSYAGDDRMTVTGHAIGTPAFMAPEQAHGAVDVDARCDIYSLAATGFALLTGRPPFVGATPWATVAQVINDPPPDPRVCNTAISPGVAHAIRSALAKDPAQRPATARAFAQSLLEPAPPPARLPDSRKPLWRRRHLWLAGAGMIAGVVLAGGLSAWGAASSPPPDAHSPASTPLPSTPLPGSAKRPTIADAAVAAPPSPSRSGSAFRDIKAGIRGTLRDALPGSVSEHQARTRRALQRQGVQITVDDLQAGRGLIEGNFPDGDALRVTLTQLQPGTTELAIQVGAFGDQTRQRTLLEWIRAEP